MMYLDLNSFAVGMATGIAATAIFVGFAALLVANAGKDFDKRGLSARHSAREQWHGELARVPDPALPVVDPQEDLLAVGRRPGAVSGRTWTAQEAAMALDNAQTTGELAALADELAPPIPPGPAFGLSSIEKGKGKPPWLVAAQAALAEPGSSDLGSSTVAGRPPARPSRHKVDALASKRLHRSQPEDPDAA